MMKKRRDFLNALTVALQRVPDEHREPLAFAFLDYQRMTRPQSPLARDLLEAISEGTDADHYDVEIFAEFGDEDLRDHLGSMTTRSLQRLAEDDRISKRVSLLAGNIVDERTSSNQ